MIFTGRLWITFGLFLLGALAPGTGGMAVRSLAYFKLQPIARGAAHAA